MRDYRIRVRIYIYIYIQGIFVILGVGFLTEPGLEFF